MGKKILSGEQIERGLKVKLIKNFANIPVDTIGVLVEYEMDEDFAITSIVLNWDKIGSYPYITYDLPEDMNIVNFLEVVD
jgi:hypothetical protein